MGGTQGKLHKHSSTSTSTHVQMGGTQGKLWRTRPQSSFPGMQNAECQIIYTEKKTLNRILPPLKLPNFSRFSHFFTRIYPRDPWHSATMGGRECLPSIRIFGQYDWFNNFPFSDTIYLEWTHFKLSLFVKKKLHYIKASVHKYIWVNTYLCSKCSVKKQNLVYDRLCIHLSISLSILPN